MAMVLSVPVTPAALADDGFEDVENFRYDSWDVRYGLSVDDAGRAQAQVTESLHAQFPDVDQNRGIIRSLPLRYQSAPAAPENITVTDEQGNPIPFEVDDEDEFRSILIGDDSFVHGAQTYVIDYTIADVVHSVDETDEFYWDLVPVDRQQPIAAVDTQITLDDTLAAATTGDAACYRGTPDESSSCEVEFTSDGSALELTEKHLASGHGLTVAVGFEPGTVVQPPERQENFMLDVLPVILLSMAGLLSAGGAVAVTQMVLRHRRDTTETSVAYGIPTGMNPLLARWLIGQAQDPIAATIMDLAVRGVLRIEDAPEQPGKPPKKPTPQVRLIDPDLATDPLENELLEAMFPEPLPGTVFTFPKNSKRFTKTAQQVLRDSGQAVIDRGYQRKVRHRGAAIAGWIALAFLVPVVVLLIMGASRDNTATSVTGVVVGLLSLALSIVCLTKHRVLTPHGAAVRRQLEQLRQIMTASENDRVAAMQSFAHAPRKHAPLDEPDTAQIVHLYDRMLPYAVLFGKQKDWSEALASAYQHYHLGTPAWYPVLWASTGTSGLHSSLNAMLSSVSSAASTSSAGAGATGGGVAGGGGGGGAAGGR